MTAANTVQDLQEEATCSICLEYYKNPVITKCGHNFCRSCISVYSEGAGKALPCPQCRKMCRRGDLRANRQLQSIVQLVQQLSKQRERPPGEDLCEEHKEGLKLFCEEDEKLICLICRESSVHEQHKVRPVEEAASKYKRELQDCLKPLREQMGALVQCKLKEEELCRAQRNKLEAEKRKIKTEFEQLLQMLKEQEQTLLRRLEEMGEKIIRVENVQLAKLSAEMSSLKDLITEIEKKCEKPAGELLKDIRSTLSRSRRQLRCGVTEEPVQPFPQTALIKISNRHRQSENIRLAQCDKVMTNPTPEQIKQSYKELLTLDADTAHACLALSEDGRRVTWRGTDSRRPHNPKRFTAWRSVLGKKGYNSGRHYWELRLLEDKGWDVGVAQESVSRESPVYESPEEGVWAVNGFNGQYTALTSPQKHLSSSWCPMKLGVYLDYDGRQLSVYNADTLEELHTFTGAAFTGRIYPYFSLRPGTDLRIV